MTFSEALTQTERAREDAMRSATAEDLRQSFRLFHGRSADDEVVRDRVGQPIRAILIGAVGSEEFAANVFDCVADGLAPQAKLELPEGDVGAGSLIDDLGLDIAVLRALDEPVDLLRALYAASPVREALEACYEPDRLEAFADGLRRLGRALDERRRLHEAAGDRLKALTDGLVLEDWRDLAPQAGQIIRLTSADPWILARPDQALMSAPLVRLRLTGRRCDGEPLRPRVYLDYGSGVSEDHALGLYPAGSDTFMALICGVGAADLLRIDPDDRDGEVEVSSLALALEPVTADALQGLVEASASEPADAPYALRLVKRLERRIFSDVPTDGAQAFALSRGLNDGCFRLSPGYGSYDAWIARYATPDEADYRRMAEMSAGFAIQPRFSFVVPTYNTPIELLRKCVNSMLSQTYRNFEICIADDASPRPEVAEYLAGLAAIMPELVRFKRRPRNGHISEASNTALSLATGDFVVLVDHDDEIPDYALFTVAKYINARPDAAILFSDEDKIDVQGRRSDPYFKSEYNAFLMYGHNMVSHLGVYCRSLIEKVGGFRKGLEGSQDYDLFFRCYEQIRPEQVVHIPHVLYHWRMIPGSTAISADQKDYAIVAAQGAINGHFERMGLPLRSIPGRAPGITAITPARFVDTPVSIIIPTRDGLDVLKPCIDSVRATTDAATVEIIIADNGSSEPETLAYLDELQRSGAAKVVPLPGEFNFSAINNEAARHATGDILCFLNNDTEVISPVWLERARALLTIPEVGAVGARLLFPDGAIQHMGVTLGLGSHRIAGHPHAGLSSRSPGYFSKGWMIAEFSAVTAACLFVRKQNFKAVAGFDESLAVAYNDVDLCLRLRASGLKIVCDADAELTHKESRTRGPDLHGARAQRLKRDAEYMKSKWEVLLLEDPYYSPAHSLDDGMLSRAVPPRSTAPWRNA